eukprot:5431582-Pleurochrysis_carterae.AAC.6
MSSTLRRARARAVRHLDVEQDEERGLKAVLQKLVHLNRAGKQPQQRRNVEDGRVGHLRGKRATPRAVRARQLHARRGRRCPRTKKVPPFTCPDL